MFKINKNKILTAVIVLLAGFILIGSVYAADNDVTSIANNPESSDSINDLNKQIIGSSVDKVLLTNSSLEPITILTFVDDVTYGENLTGTVKTEGKTGIISLTINDVVYTGTVDLEGKFILENSDSVNAGYYVYIPVTFISDDGKFIGEDDCAFSISRKRIDITGTINNITYGDNLSGSVSADFPGRISVYPGDGPISYEFNTIGEFTTEWEEEAILNPGTYTGEIIFLSDDGNYMGITDVDYTIKPKTPLQTIIIVDPVKGIAGEKVTITAKVTDENGNPVEEGTVTIEFNGEKYTADVVGGIATFEVELPDIGTYSATAYYEGLDYAASSTVFTVEVIDVPKPSPINNSGINMENTGNPLLVLLISLLAVGIGTLRRRF